MLKKVLLPAAIVAVSQMGMVHQVSGGNIPKAEEKQIPTEPIPTEAETKENLFKKYLEMRKTDLPKDVVDEIAKKQFALSKQYTVKCPTPEEIKKGFTDDSNIGIKTQKGKYRYRINDDLDFKFDDSKILDPSISWKLNNIQVNDARDGKQFVICFYSAEAERTPTRVGHHSAMLKLDIPADYEIIFEKDKFKGKFKQLDSGGITSFDPNIEFLLIKKDTPK